MTPDLCGPWGDLLRLEEDLGQSPEKVGYEENWNQRKDSGVSLLSRRGDGRWVVAVHERGRVFNLDAKRREMVERSRHARDAR